MKGLRESGIRCAAAIGENGSVDGTRDLVSAAARSGNIVLVDTATAAAFANRLERIARAREQVRDYLAACAWRARFVCVADLDDVMSAPVEASAIKSAMNCLMELPDIFGVSATSAPWYYDLLAYESEVLSFAGLEARIREAQRNVLGYYEFHCRSIYPLQRQITRLGSHLCRSAFNGLCVYRYADYVGGSYLHGNDFENCEHLSLHKSMRGTGRNMLVSSDLAIATPVGHGPCSMLFFYWLRAKKLLKGIFPP